MRTMLHAYAPGDCKALCSMPSRNRMNSPMALRPTCKAASGSTRRPELRRERKECRDVCKQGCAGGTGGLPVWPALRTRESGQQCACCAAGVALHVSLQFAECPLFQCRYF